MRWQLEVMVMAVIVALIELVLHWFPWRLALRRDLPRPAAYVLGVLGLSTPLSFLLLLWALKFQKPEYPLPWAEVIDAGDVLRQALAALWVAIVAGGLAVLAAYGLDRVADRMSLASEQEEVMELRDAEVQGRAVDEGEC